MLTLSAQSSSDRSSVRSAGHMAAKLRRCSRAGFARSTPPLSWRLLLQSRSWHPRTDVRRNPSSSSPATMTMAIRLRQLSDVITEPRCRQAGSTTESSPPSRCARERRASLVLVNRKRRKLRKIAGHRRFQTPSTVLTEQHDIRRFPRRAQIHERPPSHRYRPFR
jgi:hypothetical protein